MQHLFMGGPPSLGYCVGGRGEYLLFGSWQDLLLNGLLFVVAVPGTVGNIDNKHGLCSPL
jgi:hypothetical protein